MKKVYITALFSILCFIAFAQTAQIIDHHDNIINFGDTVIYESNDIELAEHILEFKIKNTSTSSLSYDVRKTKISYVGNSSVYFCFAGSCYGANIDNSSDPLTLTADETSALVDFSSHYKPYMYVNGVPELYEGSSFVAYTVYDATNPTDSMYFMIKYTVNNHIGIDENNNNAASVKAYPNPATDYFTVEYNFENAQMAEIQILNILGSTVMNQEISTTDNNAKINISELNSGVYFYNIIVDGNNIISKKLIVR